jgi:hypothetical protein
MSLAEKFSIALAGAATVAPNRYLVHLTRLLERLEIEAASDAVLAHYVGQLEAYVEKTNFALDPLTTNQFLQCLGEARFYSYASNRGINLQRVSEAKGERPDFKNGNAVHDIFFEVKTFSVVGGEVGLRAALEVSLEAQLSLEQQINDARDVAVAVSSIQPFATKPYSRGNVRGVIDTLIEKTRQNVSKGQFQQGSTFLVLDLSIFNLSRTIRNLRPVHWETHPSPTPVTGNLWMLAFGETEYLVHSVPEFEGKPSIEGKLEKQGILLEFPFVQGLLILNQLWDQDPRMSALVRSKDKIAWDDDQHPISSMLQNLVGDSWNDDGDSNGFNLNSEHG